MVKSIKAGCPKCFKALSTEVRSQIVDLLQDGREMAVGEIVSLFDLSQPTISYHLSELARSGLLSVRAQGRHVFYKLTSRCPYDDERCILK